MTLLASPVESLADALMMGWIRNECRGTFVYSNDPITLAQQLDFFARRPFVHAYLYRTELSLAPVGYSMVRMHKDDGRHWSTLAVLPEHRGKGYGKAIADDLQARFAALPLYTEVLLSNQAALSAHRNWHPLAYTERTVVFLAAP